MRRLLLFSLVLLAACGKREPKSARIDPAIVPLLPSDAKLVAGLRLDKLKDTPFFKKYVESQALPMLEEFQRRTGLDPRKDVWELCAVSTGKAPVIFARGKFGDLFGLEPVIKIEGMRRMNYKGFNMLGTPEYAVLFIQSGVAVAGAVPALESVIDHREQQNSEALKPMLDLVAGLPPTAHAWVVTNDGGALVPELPREGALSGFSRMFYELKQFTMYADLTTEFKLRVEGRYVDPQLAKLTHDALRGAIGFARLQTPDSRKEMLPVYDAIKVEQKETTVTITADAPFALLDQLLVLTGRRTNRSAVK